MVRQQEPGEFGDRVVSVQAIVMAWDDRYSGWQPADGGGVSNVVLYQRLRSVGDVGTTTEEEEPGPSHGIAEPSTPAATYEYIIRGERVEGGQLTLHCRVTKDICYRQAMPTFHHWQLGESKYGLVFTTSHEGAKFHNRLQKAIEHLYQQSKSISGSNGSNGENGGEDLDDDVFVPVELPLSRAESWESGVTSRSVPAESFLRIPHSSSTVVPAIVHPPPSSSVAAALLPTPFTSKLKQKKSAISATGVPSPAEYGVRPSGRTPTWPKTPMDTIPKTPLPYVYYQKEPSSATVYMKPPHSSTGQAQSSSLHRPASTGGLQPSTSHHLPLAHHHHQSARSVTLVRPSMSGGLEKRESTSSLKIPLIHHHLPPPSASMSSGGGGVGGERRGGRLSRSSIGGRASPTPAPPGGAQSYRRERCFYCKQVYSEQENVRGSCTQAPDPCARWIRRGTCLWCAECLLVRCYGTNEPQNGHEPDYCSCSPDLVPGRTVRWILLTVLALFVPCLCLYPPMRSCRAECRRRRWIGGRHRPSGSTQSSASGGRSSSAARVSATPEASSAHHK